MTNTTAGWFARAERLPIDKLSDLPTDEWPQVFEFLGTFWRIPDVEGDED